MAKDIQENDYYYSHSNWTRPEILLWNDGHHFKHLENDADPEEKDHSRIESAPPIPEISILIMVYPSNVHFGNHFRREEKSDEKVS